MILEQIKKEHIEAMKNKDTTKKSIFSIVLNEVMLLSIKKRETNEDVIDADVVRILQKAIKELFDSCENYKKVNNTAEVEIKQNQIATLESFLPKLMSEEEIKNEINNLADKSLPNVMKHFKQNFDGKCDMRVVSTVIKSM